MRPTAPSATIKTTKRQVCHMSGATLIIVTVVFAVALCGAAFALLGVKALFVKGGTFPSGHVHDNAALRRRGISCASGLNHASDSKKISPERKN